MSNVRWVTPGANVNVPYSCDVLTKSQLYAVPIVLV